VCDSPPANTCFEDYLVTYDNVGECVAEGEGYKCEYAEFIDPCPAGQLCSNGQCVDKPDPCTPNPCNTPPNATCEGGMLVTFAAIGSCAVVEDGAQCTYAPTTKWCSEGEICEDGECIEDNSDACQPNPCLNEGICSLGDFGNVICKCAVGWEGPICNFDIDECTNGTAVCDPNATCSNTDGSYDCTCNSGYTGDGKTCKEIVEDKLIINEIDYDNIGSDTKEFVEIVNAGSAPVDLSLYRMELVNGNGGSVYLKTQLAADKTTLPVGAYMVLGAQTVGDGLDDSILFVKLSSSIQNGAPDGVRIVRISDGKVMDSVAYEGTMEGVGEGTAAPSDSNTKEGSISRCPNKADTGDNGKDFVFVDTPTPGVANSCGDEPVLPFDVSIKGFTFNPGAAEVVVGQTATWTNNDTVTHNVLSIDAGAIFSPDIKPGESWSFTFKNKGMFTYICTFHEGMWGTVNVGGDGGTPIP
jgi:plastocyanin